MDPRNWLTSRPFKIQIIRLWRWASINLRWRTVFLWSSGKLFLLSFFIAPKMAEEQGPGSAFCHRFLVWCRYAGARHQQPSEGAGGWQLTPYGGVVLHRLQWLCGWLAAAAAESLAEAFRVGVLACRTKKVKRCWKCEYDHGRQHLRKILPLLSYQIYQSFNWFKGIF